MRAFVALAAAVLAAGISPASAAISQFPTSVFQSAPGSGPNNLLGNTPATTTLFNRGATPLGLGFASPVETSAILHERLTLTVTSVSASTTYVFVRLGRLTGGVFTSAVATGRP